MLTINTTGLKTFDTQVDKMTRQGKILDVLETFYDAECTCQEGNQRARKGAAAQHAHLSELFKIVNSFNCATLHAQAIGDDVSIAESTFDTTGPNGRSYRTRFSVGGGETER